MGRRGIAVWWSCLVVECDSVHLHDLLTHERDMQHKLEMIKQLRGFDIGELGSTEPWP